MTPPTSKEALVLEFVKGTGRQVGRMQNAPGGHGTGVQNDLKSYFVLIKPGLALPNKPNLSKRRPLFTPNWPWNLRTL
jgi:hypothetical protein